MQRPRKIKTEKKCRVRGKSDLKQGDQLFMAQFTYFTILNYFFLSLCCEYYHNRRLVLFIGVRLRFV